MVPTAVLAAQYAGTFEFLDTSRVDVRATQPLPVVPAPPPREVALAADASIAPIARLRLHDGRWDYALTYSPTLSVTDFELTTAAQPVVLNAGSASVGWHDRSVRVVLSEAASFGWENLAYLYGTPVAGQPIAAGQSQAPGQTAGPVAGQTTGQAPGQTTVQVPGQAPGQTGTAAVVPLQLFPYGSSATSASLALRATRRVTMSLSGGYSVTGDLTRNPQAAAVYPEQFGSFGAASVAYASSPADSFVTMATAQETTTPNAVCPFLPVGQTAPVTQTCRETAPVFLLEETARHSLSPVATASASLGVSAAVYQLASGSAWGILPAGGVALAYRLGPILRGIREQPSLRLSADLTPTINVFTGAPSNRLQISAALVSHVSTDVILSFVAGALQTVPLPHPDPSPLTVLNGGVDMRVRLTRLISVSAGMQAFWGTQQNVGMLPVASTLAAGPTTTGSEVGYVALTVRSPTLRF